jgi:hypothetical protein
VQASTAAASRRPPGRPSFAEVRAVIIALSLPARVAGRPGPAVVVTVRFNKTPRGRASPQREQSG